MHLIKTTAIFSFDEESLSDVITEGEFRFILEDVSAYNESADENCTTIRLKSGFDIRVKIPIAEFDRLMQTYLKIEILDC